ncbi:MAG: hypothetical protein Q4D91_02565 [Lautropia sp.]|nr:hypothetical protein [Lautropia sp.]
MPTLSPSGWLMLSAMLSMLSACSSSVEWAKQQTVGLGYDYQPAGQDAVHAVGRWQASRTGQVGQAGPRLILMGKHYWYALDEKSSRQLRALFDAGLSGRFQRYAFGHNPNQAALPIRIRTDQPSHFNSKFCLIYRIRPDAPFAQQTQENERLRQLNFSMGANQVEWGTDAFRLNRCFNLSGTLHEVPANTEQPAAWMQTLPLSLTLMRPRSLTAALRADKSAPNAPVPKTLPADISQHLQTHPISQYFSD